MNKNNVLIAGIAGASLGNEILKSLLLTKKYKIFGADISRFAYGHYQKEFENTFIIDENNYIDSLLDVCIENNIDFIVPGGEEPNILIGKSAKILEKSGIKLAINSPDLIAKFSDKDTYFKILSDLNIPIPITNKITSIGNFVYKSNDMKFPCIVKPSTHSGGSNFTFFANNGDEAELYISYLLNNDKIPLVQEYIPENEGENEGEFTVGVLSLPNGKIAGSIALKRMFTSKLSVSQKMKNGLISSGYTQGYIDYFPEICKQCENIAKAIDSKGPINIQGRVKNGILIPFEINMRFSASTYFRSLAGFNEIDIFLDYLKNGELVHNNKELNVGYYFRNFSETFFSNLKDNRLKGKSIT